MEEKSLNNIFQESEDLFHEIQNLTTNLPETQEKIKKALYLLKLCKIVIENAKFFSKNEEKEDLNTEYLKFILVDYYLGELIYIYKDNNNNNNNNNNKESNDNSNINRLEIIKCSKEYFVSFINFCELYNLINKEDLKLYYIEGKLDSNTIRNEKIQRFKRDRDSKKRLEILIKEKKENKNIDEEKEREIILLNIEISVRKAIENLEILKQEEDMLTKIEELKSKNEGKLPKNLNNESKSYPFKNFTIYKQDLLNNILKPIPPGWTISLEEWAELQIKRGVFPNQKNNKTIKKQNDKDENDIDNDDDEKTKKEREWDNWKDEHPKGQGNMNDNYFKRS